MKTWLTILFSPLISVCCSSGRKSTIADSQNRNERFLIITADDFGASSNINEGIEIAADRKVITAISALTNFTESLPQLKNISVNHPEIGIGAHLNITTGKPILPAAQVPSLVRSNGNFYTLEELLPVINKVSINDLRKELRAQIIALTTIDINLDHLTDQNGILTLYSPFFEIVLELAMEFNVPVRSPVIAGIKYPGVFTDSKMKKHGRQIASRFALTNPIKAINLKKYASTREIEKKVQKLDVHGIQHPDLLIEYFWGNPTTSNLNYILGHLPEGISELILHLGTNNRQDEYPSGLDLEYFNNREKELAAITSDSHLQLYNYLNIKPIGYQDIVLKRQIKNQDR